MRYLYGIIALFCCAEAVSAQSGVLSANPDFIPQAQSVQERTQVMQNRLTAMLIEEYDLGLWLKTDSVYYVYDPAYPRHHKNFDFADFTNFMYEPDFSIFEWLEYDGASWVGYYKHFGNFNAEGVRTSINIDEWDGVSYTGDARVEYTYTDEGEIDTMLFLDYAGGSYDPYARHIYTYSDSKLANIVQQSYGGDWENTLLIIYTYNDEGKIDNIVYRSWDGISWYDQSRYIYTYDAGGNLIEKLYQAYDFGWITYGRYVYGYDLTGFNTSIQAESFDGVDYIPYENYTFTEYADGLPETNTRSLFDGFIFYDYFRANFYYEAYDDGTVDVMDHTIDQAIQVYPNPSIEAFTISFQTSGAEKVSMRITNAAGQNVLRQTWEAAPGLNTVHQQIPETWAPGQYLISLVLGGKVTSTWLLVE